MSDKKILCVGLMCVDAIQICKDFPKEDSDQRSVDNRLQRGGNASNNCTVLAKCGAACEFFGTVGNDLMAEFAMQDFKSNNVIIANVIKHKKDTPFSSVIINAKSGSRTIVHSNKNMPELTFEDFKKLSLEEYDWIHFEGRNVDQVASMLKHVSEWNTVHKKQKPIKVSVELEKPREELPRLIPLADVVFVGKDFAMFQGCKNKFEAVDHHIKLLKASGGTVVCTWGEMGAAAGARDGDCVVSRADSAAERCAAPVDTLGAGDTFLAAALLSLRRGAPLDRAVAAACRVAGAKVRAHGFSHLQPGLLDP